MKRRLTTILVASAVSLLAACGTGSAGKTDNNRIPFGELYKTTVTTTTKYKGDCGNDTETDVQDSFSIALIQDGNQTYGLMLTQRQADDMAELGYALMEPGYNRDATSVPFDERINARSGEPVSFPNTPELDAHGLSIDNIAEQYAPCEADENTGLSCKEDGITSVYYDDGDCVRVEGTTLVTRASLSAKGNLE